MITLCCLTEALVINGHPDEAWELIHKQLECEETRGCINTVIHSTVLKGFAASKRVDKVFTVYKEIAIRASLAPPSPTTPCSMLARRLAL